MRKKIIRALALGVAITFGIQPVYTYAANYTNSTDDVIKGFAKENIFFSETEEGTALDSHKRINAKQLNETQYSLSAAYDYNRKDVLWGDFVCEFTVSGNAIITDYVGSNNSTITIPSQMDGYIVTSISAAAFFGHTEITEINLPEGLLNIGYNAFSGCNIRTLKLPETLQKIGWSAFDSDYLTSIVIPKNVTQMSTVRLGGVIGNAFQYCDNLETVIFEEGRTYIPKYALLNCESVKNVIIPDGVTTIGDRAFEQTAIETINLPDSINSIGERTFCDCTNLYEIELPQSVNFIGGAAFSRTGLSSFTFPDGIKNIYYSMFYECPNLNKVNLPESVNIIQEQVFYGCKNLRTIELPNTITALGSCAFSECTNLTNLVLPNKIKSIEYNFCSDCNNLYSISIPRTVTNIDETAFSGCSKLNIYGYNNSYAETYAQSNNIPFIDLESVVSITKIQGASNRYYGVNSYKNTPAGDIYDDSIAFVKAMDDYLTELKKATQKDIQTINKTSKSSAQLLREADEATNDKIITMDATMPDAALNSVYETLAQYLDTYVETGVSLGKIDMSASTIEISAGIVNKIRNNLDSLDFTRKIGKYTVTFKILKFMGAYTGSVTVQGNGRYYTGIIVSGSKETAKVLTTYMNDMSKWAEDALYQSLKSIFTELADITGISDYTKKEIKELLKDKVKLLQDKGYGDLLKYWQEMRDGYDICQKIVAAKDAANLTEALNNVESVYNKIKKLNYSDETVSNKTVSTAMNKLNSAKDKLAQSLYYYIYDKNNENGGNNNWWSNTWKSFKSIFVQCPVDFVVYDNNGNELGKVEDTETTYTSDIHINIDGDVKTIVIPSSIDARIEFVGTDTGNMTYVVEQTVDGKVTGRANFYNIPLSHGCTYSQDISGESLTEENNVILNSKDQTYKPSQYITSDNAEANVGVLCETDKGGVVVGTGIYAKGDPVVLTAYPENDSYMFGGWYINDSLVEMDNVYRFAALDDVVIRAVFKPVREIDEAYIVTMSEDYEESADIHIYKSLNELNDVVISMAGISDIEELKVLVKRYDHNYNRVDDIKIETTYDGVCRFDMPSIDLAGLSKVEIYNEQEQLIGTIKSMNAEDENQGNVTPTPDGNTPTSSPTQKPDSQPTVTPTPGNNTPTLSPTQKPDSQPTVTPTPGSNTPTSSPTQKPNSQPTVSLTPNQSTALPTEFPTLSIGTRATVGKMMYKVTKVNNIGTDEVALIGTTRKKSDKSFTSLEVGNTVKIKGKSFKVTAIGNNAFHGYKKLKSVSVGKNVKKIGTKAFYGCKNLKKIIIKNKQLQAKKVGNKAFKGIYSKVNIKVPKPKLKSYKKILRAKGVGKRAKIHT